MLLLSANRVVTVDRLLEAIYGEDLPPTSRAQAQNSISSLRRLFASHGHATTISTRAQGYVIQVGNGQLDSRRFGELVAPPARLATPITLNGPSRATAMRFGYGGAPRLRVSTASSYGRQLAAWTSSASPPTKTGSGSSSTWAGIMNWSASSPNSVEEHPLRERCAAS